jgi:hypothetical protein
MPETVPIRPADLQFDEQNARLALPNAGQRESQIAMVRNEELQRKLLILAKSIVTYGMNPTELPIVMPRSDEPTRYIVLEGNRRLSALRALENPDAIAGSVAPNVLKQLRGLSQKYWTGPVDGVVCFVVKDREEADHWIRLRHTGENSGAGVVRWGADEVARFEARTGVPEPYHQALNFLVASGELTPEARTKIPTTSFQRLMEAPEFRAKMGVEVQGGRLYLLADSKHVAKSLAWVTTELASGRTKVKDIYRKPDRAIWLRDKLPANIVIKPTINRGEGVLASSVGTLSQAPAQPKKKNVRIAKHRDRLIPSDCTLSIKDARLREIEKELRKLSLDNYANAVAVLFRVFIELGVDTYIEANGLQATNDPTLRSKLQQIKNDLLSKKKLTAGQATPVQRACAKDSFLAPSVSLIQLYVHSKSVFPAPSDLRAHWDSLQPFMMAMWSA